MRSARPGEALSLFRGLCEAPGSEFRADVARTLMNLGVDYRALKRMSEAIAVAEEAASIYRTLAHEDPRLFLPGLAFALHNLSTHYGSAGRGEEALDAAEEASTFGAASPKPIPTRSCRIWRPRSTT